jgi:hypothetical protein
LRYAIACTISICQTGSWMEDDWHNWADASSILFLLKRKREMERNGIWFRIKSLIRRSRISYRQSVENNPLIVMLVIGALFWAIIAWLIGLVF